jgi:hypothetical protein
LGWSFIYFGVKAIVGNGHSAIDKLIALTTLRQYQNGGQVLQIPQKKELDIVWPVDGESPEDMEQAKYNPVTELLLEALFEKLKRQQGQQRKPGKQLDPEAIKLYTIAQPDVV